MARALAFLILMMGLVLPDATAAEKPSRWRSVRRVSVGLLCAANAADIASSWGKDEENPLLRSGSRFSYGALTIKLGALAGALAAQHYVLHKSPQQTPIFASANLAATAALAVVAERNMRVPTGK